MENKHSAVILYTATKSEPYSVHWNLLPGEGLLDLRAEHLHVPPNEVLAAKRLAEC